MTARARPRALAAEIQRAQDDAQPLLSVALPTEIHQHRHDPDPAIITRHNCAHVGMLPPEFQRAHRAMRADPRPRFNAAPIVHGKSYRGVPTADLIAWLRASPPAPPAADADADDGLDHALLAEVGYVKRAPRAGRSK